MCRLRRAQKVASWAICDPAALQKRNTFTCNGDQYLTTA
jgi:hypothetical protein